MTTPIFAIGDTVRRKRGTGKNGREGNQIAEFMLVGVYDDRFLCEQGMRHKPRDLIQLVSVMAPTTPPVTPSPPAPPIVAVTGKTIYKVPVETYRPYMDKLAYMKDDLIHPLGLTPTRMKTFLGKTGTEIAYVEPSGTDGVVIPRLTGRRPLPADVEALYTRSPLPKTTIQCPSYNGSDAFKERYLQLASDILGPVVDKPIVFRVPHGARKTLPNDQNFTILVWSTPDQGRSITPPSELYGKTTGCRSDAYPDSGKGLPIMVGDFCVAEVHPTGVYINFDAVHAGTSSECYIFARILLDIAEAYKTVDWKDLAKQRAETLSVAEEKALLEFAKNSVARNARRGKDEKDALEKSIKAAKDAIFIQERELTVLLSKKGHSELGTQIVEEFKRLREGYANIESATFKGKKLTVVTSPINSTCKRTGNQYHLGRIRIEIPFTTKRQNLKMWTVDMGKTVPHTSSDNNAVCLGSALEEVYSYIAGYEMLAVVGFMVAFLENGIDTEDMWGRRLRNFPRL